MSSYGANYNRHRRQDSAPLPRAYDVLTAGGLIAGRVAYHEWADGQKGWYFLPTFQRRPSRRLWPTPESAVRLKHITLRERT